MGTLKAQDLPPLYCDFDQSSTAAQSTYLRVLCANFVLLVLAAAVSSYAATDPSLQQLLYAAGAILLGTGLLITVVLSRNPYEKVWYGGRAAAETVKSLSWKYMMRAAPFEGPATAREVDEAFLNRLRDILNERRELALTRAGESRAEEPISRQMRAVRSSDFGNRLTFYLTERIQDQVNWYSSKARYNEQQQRAWFWAVIGVQAVALVGAIWQVKEPSIKFNYASAFSALATALLAWSQLKRHRELSQSYSLAAHELGLAAGLASHLTEEPQLAQFVNDTETAISREHTMWIARREAS